MFLRVRFRKDGDNISGGGAIINVDHIISIERRSSPDDRDTYIFVGSTYAQSHGRVINVGRLDEISFAATLDTISWRNGSLDDIFDRNPM